jgi:hypothetical protein
MNKKIFNALAMAFVILCVSLPTQSNASDNYFVGDPVVAILDTALDNSLPIFNNRILLEACVIRHSSCPNGYSEMEGLNSSTMRPDWISKNGFNHGTEIASLAVATNPNIKIVFVRIIGSSSKGLRQYAGENSLYDALDWVIRNKDRLNIQAVSMSQGHHNLGPAGTDYCPKTPITESKIKSLLNSEIPVFFPTGNTGDSKRINWPACIPDSIAIGSTVENNFIPQYSNYDPLLVDFFARGSNIVTTVGGKTKYVSGTSASTVIAATQWATIKNSNPSLSYKEIYDLISKTSISVNGSGVYGGKLIDVKGVLNG